MKSTFFILALVLSSPAGAVKVEVISQWVMPSKHRRFELGPEERTTPVVVGDIVYVGRSDGRVAAVHRVHGYTIWEKLIPSGGRISGALAYGRSKLFVGDNRGNLYALYSRDGSLAWEFKTNSEWLSAPVVARDRVFVVSGNDEIYSLGEADGKEKWHYPQRGDEKMTVRGASVPAIFGNEVYVGFSDGNITALAAASGRMLWKQKLRSRDRFYDIDMQPWVDESGVIAATFDGSLYRLDRTTGEIKWVLRVGSYGGFHVEENRVFLSGLNGNFLAVDKDSGNVAWKTPYESGVGLAPVKVGEYLVATTSGDPMYLLNPSDGKVMWKGRLGAGAMSPVAAHPDGWFYCLSNFGNLYSFGIIKQDFDAPPSFDRLQVPSALLRFG